MSRLRPAPGRRAAVKTGAALPALQSALAALQAGRFAEAAQGCATILAHAPRNAGALHLKGIAELRLGRAAEAAATLAEAARLDPTNAEIHGNLGVALRAAGRTDEAIPSFERAIALRPAVAATRFNLANALAELGRQDTAEAGYRDALAVDANHAGAHNNLGLLLRAQGRKDEAAAHFRTALALQPKQRDAHLNLARLLREQGARAEALIHFGAALAAAPDDPTVLSERGVALVELGRAAEGVASAQRAVARAPDDPALRHNLGSALCADGQAEAGIAQLERALAFAADSAELLADLGHGYKQCGRLDDAVAAYDRALAIDAGNREARFGRAFCRLLCGEFGGGWADYRARASMASAGPELQREPLPRDLSGRRVLVRRDQGVGDELFFLRFLPELGRRGAQSFYLPDPRLAGMIGRGGIATVDDSAAADGAWDHIMSVGDLPHLLGVTDTPPPLALPPLAQHTVSVAARLAAFGPPPYVGVAWRAGTRNVRNMLYKEAPPARLAEVLRPSDARIVVVQRAPGPGEVADFAAALGRPVLDLSALNDDLEAMLALVGLLDEHVCVSNTNVHLAAARGRTCRILLPHPPEFRWMAEGGVSPWFPAMRIYRQGGDALWDDAFAALARDLAAALPAS